MCSGREGSNKSLYCPFHFKSDSAWRSREYVSLFFFFFFCGHIRRGLAIYGTNLTHNIISYSYGFPLQTRTRTIFWFYNYSISVFFVGPHACQVYQPRSLFSLSPSFHRGRRGKKWKAWKTVRIFPPSSLFFQASHFFWETLFAPLQTRTAVVLQAAVSLHLIPFSRFFYSSLFGKREKQNRRGEFLQPKSGQSRCQTFFPRVHVSQLLSQKRFLNFKKAGRFFISLFFRGRKILNFKRGGKGRMWRNNFRPRCGKSSSCPPF